MKKVNKNDRNTLTPEINTTSRFVKDRFKVESPTLNIDLIESRDKELRRMKKNKDEVSSLKIKFYS